VGIVAGHPTRGRPGVVALLGPLLPALTRPERRLRNYEKTGQSGSHATKEGGTFHDNGEGSAALGVGGWRPGTVGAAFPVRKIFWPKEAAAQRC